MDGQLQKSLIVGLVAASVVGLIWRAQSWHNTFAMSVLTFVAACLVSHWFFFRR